MPKPFANSQPITPSLISGDWLLGIQTGNSTGDNGLPQMKYIKLSQLSDWVRGTYGQMWRYRGGFSASLPSDPQDGDYFLATATFSVGADTYTKDHLYAYNGSSWDDISDILTQYASQSQVTDIDDRLTVVEVKVDAMGDGVVYKGEVATYADLAGIVDPQTGWEYFVTANASFYIYNGSSWDQIDNGIVQTITDGDVSHAPSGDAVYDALASEASAREAADSNLLSALTAVDHRVQNLEQAKGKYIVSNYKDGAITPSGKGNWAVVEGLRGVSRVDNNIARGAYSRNVAGLTITYNSTTKRITIIGTANATGDYTFYSQAQSDYVAGHKYLAITNCKTSLRLTANGAYSDFINSTLFTFSSGTVFFGINAVNGTTYNEDFYICIKDLNVYFGGTIPSDADTIAEIQQNYPHLLLPSDYGVRIVDSSYSGVRAKGVNLWDEVWQAGGLNISTGADDDTRTNRIRSENYIPVSQYKTYYYLDNSETWWAYFYDADKNYIGRNAVNGTTSFYALAGSFFMRFETWNGYGNVYKHDVQISEVFNNTVTTLNTTYHPYMESTLSLTFQGKSAGSVAEMCYPETGEQTKPLGFHTFDGTESWGLSSGYFQWGGLNNVIKRPTSGMEVPNLLLIGFLPCHWNKTEEKAIYVVPSAQTQSNYIWIKDSSLPDVASLKAYLQGKTLYYELATPAPSTFVTPIIDNTLLTESGGRMATVQTGTVVDGSFDMGFITL